MRMNLKMNKAGVSLIVVLLFMLIATIAATATWKWITSEGFSSSSRMLKREAYQSAVAGIENTRAWMTFHANDVGALIKQYIDGNNLPINLDAQLRPLQKAGQNHHVWLVGVNTAGSTYKLKILSSGEARKNTKHNEIAILNVDGLYQVSLPEKKTKKKMPFDYAYFGGSYDGAGSLTMTSAIVNGNWHGNPQGVEKTFVVTGNADLTGNDVKVGELACVGGNMNPENNGFSGKDIFVGKNFNGNMGTLSGSAYFNGNVSPSPAGEFKINGNMTLNGILKTVQNEKDLTVDGNVCLSEDAKILSDGTNYKLETKGHVWMPGINNIWYGTLKYSGCKCERQVCNWMGCMPKTIVNCTGNSKRYEMAGEVTYTMISCTDTTLNGGGDNYGNYDRIILGGTGKTAYIKTGYSWNEYVAHRNATMAEEHAGDIIRCNPKPGVRAPAGHAYCDVNAEGTVGEAEQWIENVYYPYPEVAEKDNLYYSFYLEPGQTDVSFGDFLDEYWIWCDHDKWVQNAHGTKYCSDPQEGVSVKAYFVDGGRYWDGFDPEAYHPRRRLNHSGGRATGSPYCTSQNGGPGNERNKFRPKCGVTPWFKSNATVVRTAPADKPECSDEVVEKCDAIWEKKPGCDGSSYMVDDVLVTAKSKFEPFASKGCAADITTYSSDLVEKLNKCYDENKNDATKRENNLYNGYLVVKVSGGSTSTNPTGTLNGKFIIIAHDALYTTLPPTSPGTYVMLYLEKGANTLNDATVSNYFIYTEGEIGSGNQFNLTGTIYATAESCSGLGKLQSSSIKYSEELVDELFNAGVICENDGTVCGGIGAIASSASTTESSASTGSTETTTSVSGKDVYYISMAPQLSVHLESQYENNEPIPSGANQTNLDPSFIVLPRIIYLPSDPYGELSDYYSVHPLNGSSLKKADVNVSSCSGGSGAIPTAGKLYEGVNLAKGIYKCEAKASGYTDVPFWVVVGNNHRGASPITFEKNDQDISAGGSKQVNVVIPAGTPQVTLQVACPTANEHWSYTLNTDLNGQKDGTNCTFTVQGDPSMGKIENLFTVSVDADATYGSITFQLLQSTDYSIGSPYTSQVKMSTSATLNRIEVTSDDIESFCDDNPEVCPPEGERSTWPNCTTNETWVEPTGVGYGPLVKNNSWTIVVGGSGTLRLVGKNVPNCVTIVPTNENSIEVGTINANSSKELRASLKALRRTVKVSFVGEITDNPVIAIDVNGKTSSCEYGSIVGDDKSCYISAFSGEEVSLRVDRSLYPKFNYWSCAGTCPVSGTISSENYQPFYVQDNNTTIYAHFNETDKHCFFDEFKSSAPNHGCYADDAEYCIDKCGDASNAHCLGVDDANGTFTRAKWHLITGELGNLESNSSYIYVDKTASNKGKNPIVILSTVNAGIYGTLKALFQLPRETSSYPHTAPNIAKSGFMLHSNSIGTEYLMLNMYVNMSGYLEAQICTNTGSCMTGVLTNVNSNPASVSSSNMIMMSATLKTDSKLEIKAFTGNYYYSTANSYEEYVYTFNLNELANKYADITHEFVGFSLADPNMKIYGIGWASESYSSECHDQYPSVKCSFAAKAIDGFIPTGEPVEPWVGHSAWFDSKTYSCTKTYYYYHGNDACGATATSVTSCGDNYTFAESGAGPHGYMEGTEDVKTAKAWLECHLTQEDNAWVKESDAGRANCGPFWTGKFTECSDNVSLVTEDVVLTPNVAQTVTFDGAMNLRATTLNVLLENNYSGEVEVWLISKPTDDLNAPSFNSQSVVLRSNTGSFDVNAEMTAGADGFDPENVRQIVIKNLGEATNIVVKQIAASCKNAVGISECRANYLNSEGQWEISADVVNKDKINSYEIRAVVDGGTGWTIATQDDEATPVWSGDGTKATFYKADNPYESNQGKHYQVSVLIKNKVGSEYSTTCSVSPDPIGSISSTCGIDGPATKKQGEGLPTFKANLSGCPEGGCSYELYVGGEILDGYPTNGSGAIITTPAGNTAVDYPVGTYRYTIRSTAGSASPFPDCSAEFTIVKKDEVNTDVQTECYFNRNPVTQPGDNADFKAYINGHGYSICNRGYRLLNDAKEVVASGNSTGCAELLTIDVRGINTNKSRTFTFEVKDNDGNYQTACTATTSVGSPNITCSKITESNVDKFRIQVGNPCTGNACPYVVQKTFNNVTETVSSGTDLTNGEYKIPFEGIGTYTLLLNGETVSGCTMKVEPEVECPTTKTQLSVNKEGSLFMSSLSNCEADCDYALVHRSGSRTHYADEENGNYKSATDAIKLTPTIENDSVEYTFYVYASADHDYSGNCPGTMAFVKGNSCKQITWNMTGDNSNSARPNPDYPWNNGCVSISSNRICTGQVQIKTDKCKGKSGTWNGVAFQLNNNEVSDYTFSKNPAPSTNNELSISDCDNIKEIYMDGCIAVSAATAKPSISGCPMSFTRLPNRAVRLSLTTENCLVPEGCHYTISGGSTTMSGTYYQGNLLIPGEASGSYKYSLTMENSKGTSSACEINVTYRNIVYENATLNTPYSGKTIGYETTSGTCQVEANSNDWTTQWLKTGDVLNSWLNQGVYAGQIAVESPLIFEIPNTGSLKITNCW